MSIELIFVYGPPDWAARYTLYPIAGETHASQLAVISCATAATPVPLRDTEIGDDEPLFDNRTFPVAAPLFDGLNPTLKVRLWPGATSAGSVSPLTRNPGPVVLAEDTVTVVLPVFVT
jgi:hypothetical protein